MECGITDFARNEDYVLPAGQKTKDFEQTVRAYGADLYRYAYWLCRDRFLAEDLVQEALRVRGKAGPSCTR